MKTQVFSIYDSVAEVFNKPFTEINEATAIRAFTQALQTNENKNDYSLYAIADFTDHDAEIKPYQQPKKVFTGFDIPKENKEIQQQLDQGLKAV
jgi:hypothetical protein